VKANRLWLASEEVTIEIDGDTAPIEAARWARVLKARRQRGRRCTVRRSGPL